LRNCAQAHAIALADHGKACSNAKSVVFMQRSEMKKILGKFEMHFLFLFLQRKKEKILLIREKHEAKRNRQFSCNAVK
jgi:hypothetical protein